MKLPCLTFLLVFVVACSSTHSGQGTPGGLPPDPAIDEACAADAESWCGPLERCAPLSLQELYGDKATCLVRDKLSCVAYLQTRNTESASQLLACANALNAETCDEYLYGSTTPAACKVPPGPLGDGAACTYGAQCQSLHCATAAGAPCGVCKQKSPEGGPCARSSDCTGGHCSLAAMTCVARPGLGQPCSGNCNGALICAPATPDASDGSGICQTPLGNGAACDPEVDLCDPLWVGATCDPNTRKCVTTQTVAGPGQGCDTAWCSGGASCTIADTDGGGFVCVAAPADGAACDPVDKPCFRPARCVDNVCRLPTPNACQ